MPSKKAHHLKKSRKLGKVKPLSLTTSVATPVLTSPTTATPVTDATSANIQAQPPASTGGVNVKYNIATNKSV